MFHVELRQFPHNACSFNLTEAEMGEIVEPWSRESGSRWANASGVPTRPA